MALRWTVLFFFFRMKIVWVYQAFRGAGPGSGVRKGHQIFIDDPENEFVPNRVRSVMSDNISFRLCSFLHRGLKYVRMFASEAVNHYEAKGVLEANLFRFK